MKNTTKFIGLDVSKERISIGVATEGREEARYWGTIMHTKDALRKLMNQLASEDMTLVVCYEAGPTGYPLYRWLVEMNISCTVVAPSLIPKRAGDRIKTDKRDALRLAQLFRAGELTSVYVPTLEDEALRDLVRAREDVKEDLNRHKQRLGKFLLRQQIQPLKGIKPDTTRYKEWLDTLRFDHGGQAITFQEYRHSIFEATERLKRYELEIQNQADSYNERNRLAMYKSYFGGIGNNG
jgi:transposase